MTISYPASEPDLKELVHKHTQLRDEALVLAIYYAPRREAQDIFLFEVIEGFGANSSDPDRQIFEVTYANSEGFRLLPGQKLHMLLTNPSEFEQAIGENWSAVAELREAIHRGDYTVLYEAPEHAGLLGRLQA